MADEPVRHVAEQALDEVRAVFAALTSGVENTLIDELVGARRIASYGVGREGLMMRAFTMRLFHLGLDAHVVGDMTTPPVGEGDLLVVSAGPGSFSTVMALLGVARNAGARTVTITAQEGGEAAGHSDLAVVLPARTMADDERAASVLPMGSVFEISQLVFFDSIVALARRRLDRSAEAMRAQHTNLE